MLIEGEGGGACCRARLPLNPPGRVCSRKDSWISTASWPVRHALRRALECACGLVHFCSCSVFCVAACTLHVLDHFQPRRGGGALWRAHALHSRTTTLRPMPPPPTHTYTPPYLLRHVAGERAADNKHAVCPGQLQSAAVEAAVVAGERAARDVGADGGVVEDQGAARARRLQAQPYIHGCMLALHCPPQAALAAQLEAACLYHHRTSMLSGSTQATCLSPAKQERLLGGEGPTQRFLSHARMHACMASQRKAFNGFTAAQHAPRAPQGAADDDGGTGRLENAMTRDAPHVWCCGGARCTALAWL